MKVLHISTYKFGGAGQVATEIHKEFLNHKIDSYLLTKVGKTDHDKEFSFNEGNQEKLFSKILLRISLIIKQLVFEKKYYFLNIKESRNDLNTELIISKIKFIPEIIYCYWVSDFIDIKTLEEFHSKYNTKVYWIMMDNSPITGGCHFNWGCSNIKNECEKCPAIRLSALKQLSRSNYLHKKKYASNINLIACSTSDYKRALESKLPFRKIHRLYLPVDSNKFKPTKKRKDPNKIIISYGVTYYNDPRKGFDDFLNALYRFEEIYKPLRAEKKIEIRIFGSIPQQKRIAIEKRLKSSVKFLGPIPIQDLIFLLQESDIFINTSIEDSGPYIINQSLMCGIPVISYAVGVAKDLILSNHNGFIVPKHDIVGIANSLNKFVNLSEDDIHKLKLEARKSALQKLAYHEVIKLHRKLWLENE